MLEQLSPREDEIAELVAHGMTNADIAGKLTIATRTVESHVQHILTKMNFSNRAQLVSWWAGQRPRDSRDVLLVAYREAKDLADMLKAAIDEIDQVL